MKICCISSLGEAALAIDHGACAVGLVSEMPSGPGVIPDELAREIASAVPPGVATFLLTSARSAQEIMARQRSIGAGTLQLVDSLPADEHRRLREALPGIGLVQVIHVRGPEAIEEALSVEDEVDALLLDSGNPTLEIKELGGTGRVHNWKISREIVKRCRRPVYLAGGLRPENVEEAVGQVRPFGLDVCSGVRTKGMLDARKLSAFMERVGIS